MYDRKLFVSQLSIEYSSCANIKIHMRFIIIILYRQLRLGLNTRFGIFVHALFISKYLLIEQWNAVILIIDRYRIVVRKNLSSNHILILNYLLVIEYSL